MACIRRAWLILGDRRLELEDDDAGYYCTELDLGYPEVREVMTNRPDLDGADDRTALFGARAIAATIKGRPGGTMTPDEISTLFAGVMIPSVRPELHYVLDRPGEPERMTVVRASGYAWPVSGASSREIHLGWIAADPVMRDPAQHSAIAYAGSSTSPGRIYPLTFNRIYPPGGGSMVTGRIDSAGDVPLRPLLRIYGPITSPYVQLAPSTGPTPAGPPWNIYFVAGFQIDAGHWIDVDTAAKTANRDGDPAQSVLGSINWPQSTWPVLPTLPAFTYFNLFGTSTSAITQCKAIWQDGYLT
jgi:hypothetical protein